MKVLLKFRLLKYIQNLVIRSKEKLLSLTQILCKNKQQIQLQKAKLFEDSLEEWEKAKSLQ